MKAIAALDVYEIDNPQAFEEIDMPDPVAGPLDLVIRVEAVSVNPIDTLRRKRTNPQKVRVLGFDGAGTVVAVGDEVTDFSEGDEVWWAGDVGRHGANADYQAVDSRLVARKPESWSFADAAALPLTALTAWESMFDHLRLNREDDGSLLIVGGAGGVGSILTQLAKRLTAMSVVATASREESAQWCRTMGADAVADHRDLVATAKPHAVDGYSYVFSSYTDGNIEAYAELLRPFGHVVSVNGSKFDLVPLFPKAISFHWENMFTRSRFATWDMSVQGTILSEVAALADAGDIVTTAGTVMEAFTPENLRQAHALVETRRAVGKVVVTR